MGEHIELSKIRQDGGTQPRAELNLVIIAEYAESMREGATFPDVVLFYDGSDYWLADGFHRVQAAMSAELQSINANVIQGTRRDAILYSVGANASHGLRRTNNDKRRAVETLLRDDEWQKWSDSEIARRCNVTHPTVIKYRKELSLVNFTSETSETSRTYITRHGTPATMNTTNIGAKPAPSPVVALAKEHGITDNKTVKMLAEVAEKSPQIFRQIETTGAILGIEGVDIPLSEASATDLRLAVNEDEYERALRQKAYLREKDEKRERERLKRIADIQSLKDKAELEGVYPIIYADPPWQYEHVKTPNRAIENHYETQGLDWICNLEIDGRSVAEIAGDNAMLFLWATSPKLAEAMQVIEAWGFTYRTSMVWDKETMGMGDYARIQHEFLLIARRGDIRTPDTSVRPRSVWREKPTEHSAKPHQFYEFIEQMYPDYRKLELFSRVNREGWKGWGVDYDTAA